MLGILITKNLTRNLINPDNPWTIQPILVEQARRQGSSWFLSYDRSSFWFYLSNWLGWVQFQNTGNYRCTISSSTDSYMFVDFWNESHFFCGFITINKFNRNTWRRLRQIEIENISKVSLGTCILKKNLGLPLQWYKTLPMLIWFEYIFLLQVNFHYPYI